MSNASRQWYRSAWKGFRIRFLTQVVNSLSQFWEARLENMQSGVGASQDVHPSRKLGSALRNTLETNINSELAESALDFAQLLADDERIHR